MTLQTSQVFALGVENVDLGIVEGNDDVLVSQMQTCHDTLIGSNLSLINLTAHPPSRLDLVFLLEM